MNRTATPCRFTRSLAVLATLMMAVTTPLQAQEGRATYVLPDGPGVVRQAKLSGPVPGTYAVVCDSLVSDVCRVPPGIYQLQTFDAVWRGTKSTVRVSADSTPPGGGPASPTNLRFDFYSTFAGALSWDRPATPSLRYDVTRNGRPVVEGTFGINYQERSARFVDTRYVYEVVAIDPDGRRSARSVLTIDDFEQTLGPVPDPVPAAPTAPGNLRADVYSSTNAELFWARNETPGRRTEISRDGELLGETDGSSFYDDELAGGNTYRYEIVAILSGRRSDPTTIEVTTPASGRSPSEPRVEESLFANLTARAATRLVRTVSRYYEASLPDERPYVDQVETSSPYVYRDPSDPQSREIPGRTNSVLIDIDATGTGTFSRVFTYRDLDTRQLTESIATRVHDGTSVAWSGKYFRSDSSSARLEVTTFTTDIRSTGARTRLQSGTFKSLDAGYFNTSVTYDLTVETVDGSNFCMPLNGLVTFDDEEDGDRIGRIEKREGDRYWTVSERSLDGSLIDEFRVDSIALETFCDFPER